MKIWHAQISEQDSTIGVRIGSHASVALGCQFSQFGKKSAIPIKQLFGFVALHPILQELNVIGMLSIDEQRNLVRPECALDLQTVDDLRPRPAFG